MRTIVGYRRTIIGLDFLGTGRISAGIATIHFLVPAGLQEQFIFRQSFNRPETFLTAAYLHLTNQYLFGNLLGYALAAVYTYLLCLQTDKRQWFWLTTLAFLTLLPIAVNLTSMTIWQTAYATGLHDDSLRYFQTSDGYRTLISHRGTRSSWESYLN